MKKLFFLAIAYLNLLMGFGTILNEVVTKDWQLVGNYQRRTLSGKKYGKRYK